MIELNLSRVDYIQTGLASLRCMKVLPLGSKCTSNKIAIADELGIIQIAEFKENDIQIIFKSLSGPTVNCMALGGKNSDYIYISSSNGKVCAYTKKGKLYMEFDADLTEDVNNIFVDGLDLYLSGTYTFNHYREGMSINYYLSPDRINDIIGLNSQKLGQAILVLACQDKVLRALNISSVDYIVNLESIPISLCLFEVDGGFNGNLLLYGTSDGKLGLALMDKENGKVLWQINNPVSNAGIQCIATGNISDKKSKDILLGRRDGMIEIYSYYDEHDDHTNIECDNGYIKPQLVYSINLNEGIYSVAVTHFIQPNHNEVLCHTYSGLLIGFTSRVNKSNSNSSTKNTESLKLKYEALVKEVNELESRLKSEQLKCKLQKNVPDLVITIPKFNITDNFILITEEAKYILSIQVQTAIDHVLFQSDVPLDFIETESNQAVVSHCQCDPEESGNYNLVTYRCQADSSRLEIKIQTIEGQYGKLKAYVTLALTPKVCCVKEYTIRPLSLHVRIAENDLDSLLNKRPLNSLTLSGNFNLADIHAWMYACIPEVPERLHIGQEKIVYCFKSSFLGTVILCTLTNKKGFFQSDNVSTISIVNEFISKEATERNINLEISNELNEMSCSHVINLVHPKLEAQLMLRKKVQMIDALKEIELQEGDRNGLSGDFQEILENSAKLIADFKGMPNRLELINGLLTDLYIDYNKWNGRSVRSKVPQLIKILKEYQQPKDLIDFFNEYKN